MKKQIITFIFTILCFTIYAQKSTPSLSFKALSEIKQSIVFNGEKLKTGIFSNYSQVEAGGVVKVAIVFDIPVGTCIYSNEKAKSNLPTEIHWTLPKGVTIKNVQWQKPSLLQDGEKKGYIGSAIVVTEIQIDRDFMGKEFEIKATIDYQICDNQYCIADKNEAKIKIQIGKKIKMKLFKVLNNDL